MHAGTIQENTLTHTQSNLTTVSEPSEMKPNLVDRTCELLKKKNMVLLCCLKSNQLVVMATTKPSLNSTETETK